MPNPNKPQAYNRYSYVLNNALNMSDLSGHCPQDNTPEAQACWDYLNHEFCNDGLCGLFNDWIEVDVYGMPDGVWTVEELTILRETLLGVRSAIIGAGGDWVGIAGGRVKFRRINANHVGSDEDAAGQYLIGRGIIELSDSIFDVGLNSSTGYEFTQFYILHEIGHAYDYKIGDVSPSWFKDIGGKCFITCKDTPEGYYLREYGKHTRREAWGDAFAAWAFHSINGSHITDHFPTNPGVVWAGTPDYYNPHLSTYDPARFNDLYQSVAVAIAQ